MRKKYYGMYHCYLTLTVTDNQDATNTDTLTVTVQTTEEALQDQIEAFEALEDVLVPMDPGAYNDTLDQYLNPALSYIVDDNYLYIDDQNGVKKGETAFDMLKEAVDRNTLQGVLIILDIWLTVPRMSLSQKHV